MNDREFDRLTELVNDERARRAYAEKELAQQRRELVRWRRRARSAEAAAKLSLRLPRLGSRSTARATTVVPRHRLAYPSVRVGVANAPDWLSEAFETVPLAGLDEAGLTALDLVAVGGEKVPPGLVEWLRYPTRQPLVAFWPAGELADVLGDVVPDLVVGDSTVDAKHALEEIGRVEVEEPNTTLKAEDVRLRVVGSRGKQLRDIGAVLLKAAGIDPPSKPLSVTAVVMTKRPHRVGPVIEALKQMTEVDLYVSFGTHGFTVGTEERRTAEAHFGSRVNFVEMPDGSPLGRCLNQLLEGTSTEVWAKIDDDDYYGPFYLEEALLELERTGADMVGKLTHHLYDARLDKTYLLQSGNEYAFRGYVPGPTFVGRRHTWEEVRFPHRYARVDSIFIRGVNAVGMRIYSTSRFEFSYGRGEEEHTWHVDESFYEAKGRLIAEGFAYEDIFLPASEVGMHSTDSDDGD